MFTELVEKAARNETDMPTEMKSENIVKGQEYVLNVFLSPGPIALDASLNVSFCPLPQKIHPYKHALRPGIGI